jgi:hypothetical protein
MSGLTNEYVEKVGKKILGSKFLGTFPCDLHPKTANRKHFCLVFNLSKHDSSGSHFIAIFASKNEILYFDPFGEKPDNDYIKKFIQNNKKMRKIVVNRKCIQSCSSIFCGFYCLGFLLSQIVGLQFKDFIKIFNLKDLGKNDQIIINFLQNYI